MPAPLILDFDTSLPDLPAISRIPLGDWQERIRFGCTLSQWRKLAAHLLPQLPGSTGTVCLGSGDYHHLSHLLLARLPAVEPIEVVVFDNHPDNMRYLFGIHCGSWVYHAAKLPQVAKIHVIGITSGDVGWLHAWENHLLPLWRGKVEYWSIGVSNAWAHRLGLGQAFHAFDTREAMLQALHLGLAESRRAVYLSIDKDVLDPGEVHTNWDQGCLRVDDLCDVIGLLQGRIIGSDITGEISEYRYASRWKRFLSDLDGQSAVSPVELARWQAQQAAVTLRLIEAIDLAVQA